jgi:hypothetical protein
VNRISVRCKVQCAKCGWKSKRHLHVNHTNVREAMESVHGSQSYNHIGCRGKVFVSGTMGAHTLQ